MKKRIQFGLAVLGVVAYAALAASAWAQKPHAPASQSAPLHAASPHSSPAHPQNQNVNRPPANPNRPQGLANPGSNRPPRPNLNNENRFSNVPGARLTPRQQVGVGSPRPWVDTMRDLTPQERERVFQHSRAFQSLSPDKQSKIRQQFSQWDHMTPQQQASIRQSENTWRKLTPEQRDHIKNDVLPRWRQMPWDRQQVMKQKLGVLQNMPESARNRRLDDPNFTRGMSDEEKSMLHDLAHTHVGGPPEPPGE